MSFNCFKVYFHHLIFIHYYKSLYSCGLKPHLYKYIYCGWIGCCCAMYTYVILYDEYVGTWHVVVFLKEFYFLSNWDMCWLCLRPRVAGLTTRTWLPYRGYIIGILPPLVHSVIKNFWNPNTVQKFNILKY